MNQQPSMFETTPATTVPKYGITVLAHVEKSLGEANADLAAVTSAITGGRRLRPVERDNLQRTLAGVIGGLETVRIWLNAGAPQ